jgi:pre-rRNA-processing protein TSR1
MEFSHRPTLKQQNKKFKSKHATKSQEKNKGKASLTTAPKKSKHELSKADRINKSKLLQHAKRLDVQTSTRLFNGTSGTPKIIVCFTRFHYSIYKV